MKKIIKGVFIPVLGAIILGFIFGKYVFKTYKDSLYSELSSSRLYSGTMREIRYHNFSTSEYSLTISYSFNSIKNKYKGKGSGKEHRQRL